MYRKIQQNSVTKSETSEPSTPGCLQKRLPGTSFQAGYLMKTSWTPSCKQSRVHHVIWVNVPSSSQQKQEELLLYSGPVVKAETILGANPLNLRLLRGQDTQTSFTQTWKPNRHEDSASLSSLSLPGTNLAQTLSTGLPNSSAL